MIDPESSGILRKRKSRYSFFVDFVIELEEDTEASAGEGGMCGFRENVVTQKRHFCMRQPLRCQELFDRVVGKLDNLGVGNIDDGDEAGTGLQNGFASVDRPPSRIKCGGCCPVETNCKQLGEFFDAKRADGDSEASEETLRICSFLFIDAEQRAGICFIQTFRQVI
jgi:hypothetical protein